MAALVKDKAPKKTDSTYEATLQQLRNIKLTNQKIKLFGQKLQLL